MNGWIVWRFSCLFVEDLLWKFQPNPTHIREMNAATVSCNCKQRQKREGKRYNNALTILSYICFFPDLFFPKLLQFLDFCDTFWHNILPFHFIFQQFCILSSYTLPQYLEVNSRTNTSQNLVLNHQAGIHGCLYWAMDATDILRVVLHNFLAGFKSWT